MASLATGWDYLCYSLTLLLCDDIVCVCVIYLRVCVGISSSKLIIIDCIEGHKMQTIPEAQVRLNGPHVARLIDLWF